MTRRHSSGATSKEEAAVGVKEVVDVRSPNSIDAETVAEEHPEYSDAEYARVRRKADL